MEIFATVFSGVCVYVLGQVFLELYIKPYRKYKKLKGLIVEKVGFYANTYGVMHNEIDNQHLQDRCHDASYDLRDVAMKLRAFIEIMPIIHVNIPSKNDLNKVSKNLIMLSNSINAHGLDEFKEIREAEKEIHRLLKSYKE